MSERLSQHASISYLATDPEEGLFGGYEHARIDCPRCEEAGGWDGKTSGLHCPYDCGVRLFSVQVEENKRVMSEQRIRDTVRRDERAARRARRTR